MDDDCATDVPGLFAAGDSCGTCFIGASYSGSGFATMHAAATGARAGLGAGREAAQTAAGRGGSRPSRAAAADSGAAMLDNRLVADAVGRVLAPLERKGGLSPRW